MGIKVLKQSSILIAVVLSFFGCGESLSSNKLKSLGALQRNLEKYVVSENLRLRSVSNCDMNLAATILNESVSENPKTTLRNCEVLYSCSESASAATRTWSVQRLTFSLGKAPFNKIKKISSFSDKTNGVYFADTHRIYLDSNIPTVYETCAVLLHEISHRADSNITIETQPNFETEFPAYYLEESFAGELAVRLSSSKLNKKNEILMSQYLQFTLESFFEHISKLLGTSSTSLSITDFSRFSWENTQNNK